MKHLIAFYWLILERIYLKIYDQNSQRNEEASILNCLYVGVG